MGGLLVKMLLGETKCLLFLLLVVIQLILSSHAHRELATPHFAQDRHFHWVKQLKKHKKRKLRNFVRRFKKCAFPPYKFKIMRRSGGDMATIHIVLPYQYEEGYFPKYQNDSKVYSAKYRSDQPLIYKPRN